MNDFSIKLLTSLPFRDLGQEVLAARVADLDEEHRYVREQRDGDDETEHVELMVGHCVQQSD